MKRTHKYFLQVALLLLALPAFPQQYLGNIVEDSTVYFIFSTQDSTGAAADPSGSLENNDITIWKDNSGTQLNDYTGVTVDDDWDTNVGIHHVSIDTSATAHSGFWAAGSQYTVVFMPDTETVDGQTVRSVIARFSIEGNITSGSTGYGGSIIGPGNLGSYANDSAVDIYFATVDSNGKPIALSSALDTSDFRIEAKGKSAHTSADGLSVASPQSSTAGWHRLIIDTSNDTNNPGFWSAGTEYTVFLNSAKTLDGQTIKLPIAWFSLDRTNITSASIASGAIAAGKLGTGAIVTGTIAAATLTADKFGGDFITASSIAADAGTELGTANWATTSRVLTANTNLNDPTAAAIADAVFDETATGHTDAGKAGEQIWTNIPAILADTAAQDTSGELRTLLFGSDTPGAIESTLTTMKGATFSGTTDSLEAIRDRGDAAWTTGTGTSTLTTADLDTALATYDGPTNSEMTAAFLALVGADADTLETLSDQIDTISLAGIAGAIWNALLVDYGVTGSFGEAITNLSVGAAACGTGDTAVFDDTGYTAISADGDLTYKTALGVGIEAQVIAYVTADLNAGFSIARGSTVTKADGTFASPLMLDDGVEYTIVYYATGYTNYSVTITVG